MKLFGSFSLVLVQFIFVAAGPVGERDELFNKGCSKDACLQAVTSNRLQGASASPGCTSFFRVTITPTPSTTKITRTVTKHTSTVITKTDVQPTSITETDTVTSTATVTSTVATVTSTPGMALILDNDARKACPTTPAAPSKVPTWASQCTNTVVYSSACACVNAPHLTVTKKACTVTSSVTQKITKTKRVTSYLTKASSITVATVTETESETSTSQVTKTVTAAATCTAAASTFQLDMTGGAFNEQPLSAGIFAGSQFPVFSPFLTAPQTIAQLSLDRTGRLFIGGTTQFVSTLKLGGGTLFVIDTAGPFASQFSQPTFSVGNDPDCRSLSPNAYNNLAYCPLPSPDGVGLVLTNGLLPLDGCFIVTVQAQSS